MFDTRSVEEGLFGDSSRGHARRDSSSSTSAACVALTPRLASSAASQVSHSLTALQRKMEVQSGVQQPETRPLGSPRSGANQQNETDDRPTDASGRHSADNHSKDAQEASQKDDKKEPEPLSVNQPERLYRPRSREEIAGE
ncbi:hypothetical protein D9C73_023202 [Collichthys lucidus]|uniref:Uncharacterized protein n=1 Tax=Collichthys lucidus TaxID=240159 RepID=A0A4U5VJC0_COLLU|nr:hypothetical protein D9C73_023202 [Collichthys lucidus]